RVSVTSERSVATRRDREKMYAPVRKLEPKPGDIERQSRARPTRIVSRLQQRVAEKAAGSPLLILTCAAIFLGATLGVRAEKAELVSGIINTSQQPSAPVGFAALATIAATRTADLVGPTSWHAEQTHALVAGFHRGFIVAGILLIAATVAALVAIPHSEV